MTNLPNADVSDSLQYDDVPTAKPSAAPLPVPGKDNDWLGFCQSAIKLQNGDRKVSCTTLSSDLSTIRLIELQTIGCPQEAD